MTDIEKVMDAVIEAARAVDEHCSHTGCCSHCEALKSCLLALDAALKPDPWKLLDRCLHDSTREITVYGGLQSEIRAALAWREANPDA